MRQLNWPKENAHNKVQHLARKRAGPHFTRPVCMALGLIMEETEIKKKYSALRASFIAISGVLFALICVWIYISGSERVDLIGIPTGTWLFALVLALVVYGIFFFHFYRCPSCLTRLPKGWSIKKCQSCGCSLSE